MKIAVIVSKDCPAGNNVKHCLLEILGIDDDNNIISNDNKNNNNDNNNNVTNNKNNDDNKIKNNNDNIINNINNINNNNNNNKNIINKIININEDAKLYIIDKLHVYADNLDEEIQADLFIFATTHKSEYGVPSLSVHVPGNWAKAELGGHDRELCIAPAFFLKESLKMLEKFNDTDFEVIQECTHHGPFMKKPCMFIEIGSSEREWSNKQAGMVNAKVINYIINNTNGINNKNYRSAFGIGGLHHTPGFKRIVLNTHVAIGHVCPKYNLRNLNQEMLEQAMERSFPKAEFVIMDWKGLGGFKRRIKDLLEKNNIVYKKTKQV